MASSTAGKDLFSTPSISSDQESGSQEQRSHGERSGDHREHLQRQLSPAQIMLFSIGGAIGSALFIQMGFILPVSGPGGLLFGFLWWSTVMLCVNNCFGELVAYAPIAAPAIRLADLWVDPALSFAMGYNYFVLIALLIPFEITVIAMLVDYWTDALPLYAVFLLCLGSYAFLNLLTVRYFGISELWMSMGKVILVLALFMFTFVTMVGGNPLHDAYGFRYWRDPGFFGENLVTGSTGRFLGFVAGAVQANFTMCGPEVVSMTASEAAGRPTAVMARAYRATIARILFFICGSALCMGIVIPYDDRTLLSILAGGAVSGTGAASPYVIAMNRLEISGFPHVVNALILTSVLSGGNATVFAASRTLYGIALEGNAPAFLRTCTRNGVPIYCVFASMAFACLALLGLSASGSEVLGYLVDLVTACQLLNYVATCVVYLHFYWACEAQGFDRRTLPFRGWFQPYTTYYAIGCGVLMLLVSGYNLFFPGHWSTRDFFLRYTMVLVFALVVLAWKVVMKTSYVRPGTADLTVRGMRPEIERYEANYVSREKSRSEQIFDKVFS